MRSRKVIEDHALLAAQLEQVQEHIAQARDYYTLHLLESIDTESKRLSELTESLIAESKKLTTLTKVLVVLTVVLAILALPSLIQLMMKIGLISA